MYARIYAHTARFMNREKTNLTILPSVKKQASKIAKSEGRSLSELAERLLEKFVKAHQESAQEDAEMSAVLEELGKTEKQKAAEIMAERSKK